MQWTTTKELQLTVNDGSRARARDTINSVHAVDHNKVSSTMTRMTLALCKAYSDLYAIALADDLSYQCVI